MHARSAWFVKGQTFSSGAFGPYPDITFGSQRERSIAFATRTKGRKEESDGRTQFYRTSTLPRWPIN